MAEKINDLTRYIPQKSGLQRKICKFKINNFENKGVRKKNPQRHENNKHV